MWRENSLYVDVSVCLVFGCEKQRVKVNESVFMIGYCFKPIAMSLLDCYYKHWNECMYCRRVLQSASLIPNASIALICALAYNQHNHKMDLVLSIWRTLIDIHNTHTHSLPVAVVVAPFACFSLSQKKHTHTLHFNVFINYLLRLYKHFTHSKKYG